MVSVTENRSTDTKPNTNQNHGKILNPNQLKNMREIPTFYRIQSLLFFSFYAATLKKVTRSRSARSLYPNDTQNLALTPEK